MLDNEHIELLYRHLYSGYHQYSYVKYFGNITNTPFVNIQRIDGDYYGDKFIYEAMFKITFDRHYMRTVNFVDLLKELSITNEIIEKFLIEDI